MQLKQLDYMIISQLMKNSRASDRHLAKIIGTSQPTITRRRTALENKIGLNYTAIPDFSKLGFEILAFSFYSWKPEATKELYEDIKKILHKLNTFLEEHKNVLFTANGRGFGMERMMISFHESYSDYMKLMQTVDQEWGAYLAQSSSFIVSLKEDVVGRALNFKHMAEYLMQNRQ